LSHLKADPLLRHLPVVVISAVDDMESVVRCIELGADDYMFKPFNKVLLKARVNACLEKKRLRDQERAYLQMIQAEQQKSERLLLNILPQPIAERLKQGQVTIADNFADVTVLFADLVDFTKLSARITPRELVSLLNEIFSTFDQLADRHGLEKIKTVGDAYLVVGGLPMPRSDHAEAIAEMALEMQQAVARLSAALDETFSIRIGINTGPVVAGVIGAKKFSYDLWGDTVNVASRMESHGLAGQIQVTTATYERLQHRYELAERGCIPVKGKGEVRTYLLTGKKTQNLNGKLNPTAVPSNSGVFLHA
jgi:class 3 adenylate cyclase